MNNTSLQPPIQSHTRWYSDFLFFFTLLTFRSNPKENEWRERLTGRSWWRAKHFAISHSIDRESAAVIGFGFHAKEKRVESLGFDYGDDGFWRVKSTTVYYIMERYFGSMYWTVRLKTQNSVTQCVCLCLRLVIDLTNRKVTNKSSLRMGFIIDCTCVSHLSVITVKLPRYKILDSFFSNYYSFMLCLIGTKYRRWKGKLRRNGVDNVSLIKIMYFIINYNIFLFKYIFGF